MTSPERVEEATRSFIADYPEVEADLETLIDIDAEQDGWTFDDIPFDSGRFGELVSRDIAEKGSDGDYRLVDRAAVARVIEAADMVAAETMDASDSHGETEAAERDWNLALPTTAVDPGAAGLLSVALALLVGTRMLYYDLVFRDGYVVSPANDPYFYRFWQEQLLAISDGATDLSMIEAVGRETSARPFTHLMNWWLGELFGPATVAAWLPVVLALLLGIVVYLLTLKLTTDRRIGIAAVLLLGLTPILAVYTSLGFLEHRGHQYLWLAILAYSLVWLADDVRTRRNESDGPSAARQHRRSKRALAMAGLLAVSVVASAHAWGGSPLTFVPVSAYLAFRVAADIRADVPPVIAGTPTLAGIGVGGLGAWLLHSNYGWHEAVAGSVPVLVAAGGISVALAARGWQELDLSTRWFVAAEVAIGFLGLVLFRYLRPDDVSRLQERSDALFGRTVAIETGSLFSLDQFVIFGPMSQLGFGFFLALAPLGIVTLYVKREYRPAWLAVGCFTWFYLLLATIQIRFAAQLSIFIAILGGVAIVYLLGVLELVPRPDLFGQEGTSDGAGGLRPDSSDDGPSALTPITVPEPKRGAYIVGILAVILLMNMVFVPTLLGDIYYSEDSFGATTAIMDHADKENSSQPEFVLSHWGENRMHNYFLSGESRGYGYARSNHDQFLVSENPDERYNNLNNRVGYIVINEREVRYAPAYVTLFEHFGAGDPSVGHYQLFYSTDDVRAFLVVEGARLRTTADQNATLTASTEVSTAGETFSYERSGEANGDGTVTIRVAYPGEYTVGNETVTVTQANVTSGQVVSF